MERYIKEWILKLSFSFLLVFSTTLSVYSENTLKERLELHVYTLASDEMQGRKAGTKYARMAAEYIVNQFEEIGIEPFFENSYLQPFWNNRFQNIVGIIPGNDPVLKDEYIIIGAHYDHIGTLFGVVRNGADDNASGTAVLIELARELKHIESNLKRSIILIAFDAEETGVIGSTHFINRWEISNESIKLMISVDMVGWYKTSGMVEYAGSGTIQGGNEIILNSEIVPAELNVVAKNFETSLVFATDTHPFALEGIPTLYVNTGLISPYHSRKDEAHLIDYEGMALIVEHLRNVVETISQEVDFQSSGRHAWKHKPRQRIDFGVSVNIDESGNYYNYFADKNNENGLALSFGAGVLSQFNFGIFAIRPELQYDHTLVKYPLKSISINTITVPLSLVLQTPNNWFMGGDIFFGGYYSYLFNDKSDAGLTFGLGLNMKPFKLGFTERISLMDFSLMDFSQSSSYNGRHIQNRSYFTITYMF